MSDMIAEIDKRGLIKDSYLIEGIRVEECRSIFLDWTLFENHKMLQSEKIKLLDLSRFSSGLFRAMFAMNEIWNGKEIHRRVPA